MCLSVEEINLKRIDIGDLNVGSTFSEGYWYTVTDIIQIDPRNRSVLPTHSYPKFQAYSRASTVFYAHVAALNNKLCFLRHAGRPKEQMSIAHVLQQSTTR